MPSDHLRFKWTAALASIYTVKTCTLHDQTSALVSGSWWLMFLTSTKPTCIFHVFWDSEENTSRDLKRVFHKIFIFWRSAYIYGFITACTVQRYYPLIFFLFFVFAAKRAAHLLANLSDSNRILPSISSGSKPGNKIRKFTENQYRNYRYQRVLQKGMTLYEIIFNSSIRFICFFLYT